MKSPAAYYLMLIYVTVMIKPLLPFIYDAWSHEFNEIEHISIIHARYGSHHLERELADTDTDDNKSKNQNILRSEDQVPFHVLAQVCKFDLIANKASIQHHNFTLHSLPNISVSNQGPPPKFS